MMRLLYRGSWVCPHLAGSDQETLLFNTVRPLSCCGVFRGNYCLGLMLNYPHNYTLVLFEAVNESLHVPNKPNVIHCE